MMTDRDARPSLRATLMECALSWAARSTCSLGNVGCVVALDGRILSTGYNGAPAGLAHCVHRSFTVPEPHQAVVWPDWIREHVPIGVRLEELSWQPGSMIRYDGGIINVTTPHGDPPTCQVAVHAELNAIAFAARNGVALAGATLYTTLAPCLPCAQAIVQTGITDVVAERTYRIPRGVDLLRSAGVDVTVNR